MEHSPVPDQLSLGTVLHPGQHRVSDLTRGWWNFLHALDGQAPQQIQRAISYIQGQIEFDKSIIRTGDPILERQAMSNGLFFRALSEIFFAGHIFPPPYPYKISISPQHDPAAEERVRSKLARHRFHIEIQLETWLGFDMGNSRAYTRWSSVMGYLKEGVSVMYQIYSCACRLPPIDTPCSDCEKEKNLNIGVTGSGGLDWYQIVSEFYVILNRIFPEWTQYVPDSDPLGLEAARNAEVEANKPLLSPPPTPLRLKSHISRFDRNIQVADTPCYYVGTSHLELSPTYKFQGDRPCFNPPVQYDSPYYKEGKPIPILEPEPAVFIEPAPSKVVKRRRGRRSSSAQPQRRSRRRRASTPSSHGMPAEETFAVSPATMMTPEISATSLLAVQLAAHIGRGVSLPHSEPVIRATRSSMRRWKMLSSSRVPMQASVTQTLVEQTDDQDSPEVIDDVNDLDFELN